MDKINQLTAGLRPDARRSLLKDLATEIVLAQTHARRPPPTRKERKLGAAKAMGLRHVYVIGAPGYPLKIGIAADPVRRLGGIQTGCAYPLSILFTMLCQHGLERKVEAHCHATLHRHRLSGEWFDAELSDAISTVEAAVAMFGGEPTVHDPRKGRRYSHRYEQKCRETGIITPRTS